MPCTGFNAVNLSIQSIAVSSLDRSSLLSSNLRLRLSSCKFSRLIPTVAYNPSKLTAKRCIFDTSLSQSLHLEMKDYSEVTYASHLVVYYSDSHNVDIDDCIFSNIVTDNSTYGACFYYCDPTSSAYISVAGCGFHNCYSQGECGVFYISGHGTEISICCITNCSSSNTHIATFMTMYSTTDYTLRNRLNRTTFYDCGVEDSSVGQTLHSTTYGLVVYKEDNLTTNQVNGGCSGINFYCTNLYKILYCNVVNSIGGTMFSTFSKISYSADVNELSFVNNSSGGLVSALFYCYIRYCCFADCIFMRNNGTIFPSDPGYSSCYFELEGCYLDISNPWISYIVDDNTKWGHAYTEAYHQGFVYTQGCDSIYHYLSDGALIGLVLGCVFGGLILVLFTTLAFLIWSDIFCCCCMEEYGRCRPGCCACDMGGTCCGGCVCHHSNGDTTTTPPSNGNVPETQAAPTINHEEPSSGTTVKVGKAVAPALENASIEILDTSNTQAQNPYNDFPNLTSDEAQKKFDAEHDIAL